MARASEVKLTIYRFDFCCWDETTYYQQGCNDLEEIHDSDEAAILAAECYVEEKLKHPKIVKATCAIHILLGKHKLGRHVKTISRQKPEPTLQFPKIPN